MDFYHLCVAWGRFPCGIWPLGGTSSVLIVEIMTALSMTLVGIVVGIMIAVGLYCAYS